MQNNIKQVRWHASLHGFAFKCLKCTIVGVGTVFNGNSLDNLLAIIKHCYIWLYYDTMLLGC